jgi:hypothetical protein
MVADVNIEGLEFWEMLEEGTKDKSKLITAYKIHRLTGASVITRVRL